MEADRREVGLRRGVGAAREERAVTSSIFRSSGKARRAKLLRNASSTGGGYGRRRE